MEKLDKLVSEIGELSVDEYVLLIDKLKSKFKIENIAPVIQGAAVQQEGSQQAEEKEEKTHFNLILKSIKKESKLQVIKEIRNIVKGIDLKSAKALTEELPKTILENADKESVTKHKESLGKVGAEVSLE
jgi:ribosomal protein L7/L12